MLPLSLNCPEYWQGFTHAMVAYTAVLIVVWAFCGWLTLFNGSHKPE